MKKISKYNLNIDKKFYNFINKDVLPGTNINEDYLWKKFSDLVKKYSPINKRLLKKRLILQNKISDWHKSNLGKTIDYIKYKSFLQKIGYIVKEGKDFNIKTKNVDPEIAKISGPQLVVPITNARYATNAVNARWGSMYDAVYGTDILGNLPKGKTYNSKRGDQVIHYCKSHLDKIAPLYNIKWNKVNKILFKDNEFKFFYNKNAYSTLIDNKQIVGYNLNKKGNISEILLIKNNLHIRIKIDKENKIGKNDLAGISDIILESAISVILDLEDSVSTVDVDDKILAYKNLLGLMKGNIKTNFIKNKKVINRSLKKNLEFFDLSNYKFLLKSKSLMLIRNVGHLMTSSAILDEKNNEIGEGIMDALITSLISLHDLKKEKKFRNSENKSIYLVKPKMHGPEEVNFTNSLFQNVEKILKIPKNTIKIGIMDEERRTSINLKECIRVAKNRVFFINTGFLDRTGDEIHTSMHSGPFIKKGDMKNCDWIKAYEKRNVEIGLQCGLQGKAQIGKGMWAMPDLMSLMLEQKITHLKSGANCSWVPSPTAATLHSIHYHLQNVNKIQKEIILSNKKDMLKNLLKLPLLNRKNLSELEIDNELENNAQSILGYVVRWIDQGIGCSKVPDINNIALMEDRATCRISSQALTNWLLHKIISKEQVIKAFKKMAKVVDNQNKNDPNYIPMSKTYNNLSFKAACDLVFLGADQPSGYTEPILHKRRKEFKKNKKS